MIVPLILVYMEVPVQISLMATSVHAQWDIWVNVVRTGSIPAVWTAVAMEIV